MGFSRLLRALDALALTQGVRCNRSSKSEKSDHTGQDLLRDYAVAAERYLIAYGTRNYALSTGHGRFAATKVLAVRQARRR